ELDDTDTFDILDNADYTVLLFVGSDNFRVGSQKQNMKKLAAEFHGKVFFGIVDSIDSPSIRSHLKIPRKQHVTTFIHKGSVVERRIGKIGMKELRQGISELVNL
ncbi:MAG: hypothetical protein P1Q69_21480, partial [Candidatus Thorarchaeota archaeon]|nr:hypothetical protein [Candidatus Thorarchaeota archaeon]